MIIKGLAPGVDFPSFLPGNITQAGVTLPMCFINQSLVGALSQSSREVGARLMALLDSTYNCCGDDY